MTTITAIPPEGLWVSQTVPPEVIDRIYEGLILNNQSVPAATPVPLHSLCNSWVVHGCISLGDPRIGLLQTLCVFGVGIIGLLVYKIARQHPRKTK